MKRQTTTSVRTTTNTVASVAVRLGALAFVFRRSLAAFSVSSMAVSFGMARWRVAIARRVEAFDEQRPKVVCGAERGRLVEGIESRGVESSLVE